MPPADPNVDAINLWDADRLSVIQVTIYCARRGEDARFQSWQKSIRHRALAFPGIVGIDVIPSTVNDAGHEWIVVYRFRNSEGFHEWIRSRERADMLATTPDIFTEEPIEYTLRGPQVEHEGQSIVTANAVIAGKEADYAAADRALTEVAARFPGFVGTQVFKPGAGSNIWSTLVRFDNKTNMERWLTSKECADGREALYRYVVSHQANVVPTGFGSWFAVNAVDSIAAPAWKQAMIVLLAIFPVVMILHLTVGDFLTHRGFAFSFSVFVANAFSALTLSWAAMPLLTRLMDWWLSPRATSRSTLLGVLLLLVLYAIENAIFLSIGQAFYPA